MTYCDNCSMHGGEHTAKCLREKSEPAPKTLRDEFAAAALTGIIKHGLGGWSHVSCDNEDNNRRNREIIAGHAYGIADAMLAERGKK